MSNKNEITAEFLKVLEAMAPGNQNVEMYKTYFNEISDEAFHHLMTESNDILPFYSPNLTNDEIDLDTVLKVGEEMLGIKFFQQLILVDPDTGVEYITPEKYLVILMMVRRQSQHVTKGLSVAEDSAHIDSLTGQASGPSKVTQITAPEVVALESLGQVGVNMLKELINVRGGNVKAFQEARRQLENHGIFSLADMEKLNSRPEVIETLKSYLRGMMLDSNL